MSVSSVSSVNRYAATSYSAVKKAAEQTDSTIQQAAKTTKAEDTVEISKNGANASKTKGLSADQLKQISEQQTSSFKNMLAGMLNKQAGFGGLTGNHLQLNKDLFSKLNISAADSAKAAEAISENGEWGVNAVATRIMDMAVALSGGDSQKAAVLRDAVEKGFGAAEKQWGGKLPSISYQTKTEIGNRFDYWEKNGTLDGYGKE